MSMMRYWRGFYSDVLCGEKRRAEMKRLTETEKEAILRGLLEIKEKRIGQAIKIDINRLIRKIQKM